MSHFKAWLHSHFPALASRDFAIFLSGQFVSVIGTWMQATALPYLAYRISGRPFDLGLIGFATTLPTLFFALPAGVLVERWDKRKTVIILQSIMGLQAFGLTYLAFFGHIQIWQIVLLSALFGTAVAVEVTARQSMLIELTGRETLPSAIALQTTAFNVGRVLGPLAAAGIIASTGGESAVFLVNGLSYIFVIAGLFMAQTRFREDKSHDENQGMGSAFKEGIAYIRSNTSVMAPIIMSTLLGFFGIPLLQQIPAFARDVLKTAMDTEAIVATRTSNLFTAQGIGALVAAFMMAYLSSVNKNKILLYGQIAFTIPVILLGLSTNMKLSLLLLVFIGWGTVAQLISNNIIIQMRVPNELRGRVFSIYFWTLQGVAPFGSIVIGWVAQTWSVKAATVMGGFICLIGFSMARLLFKRKATLPLKRK